MNRQQIQDLINRGVAEAKSEISEARLKHLIWIGTVLVGVFGVIVPIWFTTVNTSKVDSAISEMNGKFDKLVASQQRKPEIQCRANGRPIENSIITLDPRTQEFSLELANSGNGTAYNTETFLFIDYKDSVIISASGMWWYQHPTSDDPAFSKQFEITNAPHNFNPQRNLPIRLKVQLFKAQQVSIPAKIIMYSVDAGPWEFRFTINKSK